MPGIITKRFRIDNAKQFFDSITAATKKLYIFIGRVTPYADEAAPTTPTDTIQNTHFDGYRDMIAMKRVQSSDMSQVIPKYSWANNTAYTQYTDTSTSLFPTSTSLYSNTTFYVLTDADNVYKCIYNNRGGRSTIKPTGTSTSIITTADKYRWKFLYNVSGADKTKFFSTSYIPVKTLTANNGSAQWSVQTAASNGAIHNILITANGTGYLTTSNTFSSISNSTTMVLKNNANTTDDMYTRSTLYLSTGLGAGQLRRIVNYVGATRTVTVNTAFTQSPNTSTGYIVGPNVIIKGDSGATSALRALAYVSNAAYGQIRSITMINEGLHYSTANVSISANSSYGSGCVATPIISPKGGHGKDPVQELGAVNVMLSVRVTGAESNTFPTNNDFRMIGIVSNPLLRGGPSANASVIDQCSRITITALSGDLTSDEIITGGTSGAKSRFVQFANTNNARTAGIVRVIRVTTNGTGGTYTVGETITGSVSGKTATIASFTKPAVREFTGNIIYTENRTSIARAPEQLEDIKMVVKF
jgi:hypothetical protein